GGRRLDPRSIRPSELDPTSTTPARDQRRRAPAAGDLANLLVQGDQLCRQLRDERFAGGPLGLLLAGDLLQRAVAPRLGLRPPLARRGEPLLHLGERGLRRLTLLHQLKLGVLELV